MKKLLSVLLCFSILMCGCGNNAETSNFDINLNNSENTVISEQVYSGLDDEALLLHIEDDVYSQLESTLDDSQYRIDSVCATYMSKEYVEELEFNSQKNIYFGYTLDELNDNFQGKRYVFTLGENGETVVQELQEIEDVTMAKVLKNVAIGAGVILVCVTISAVTAGIGAPAAITSVFAVSAKTATVAALSTSAISGLGDGIVKYIETGDLNQALKTGLVSGSEGFKIGAISGAISGGAGETIKILRANKQIPTPRQSELDVLKDNKGASEQVAFLDGKKVSSNTKGSTRPDVVIEGTNGTYKAIEVKNYDLSNNKDSLISELKRQVGDRVQNMPKGSTQEIVLDVRGRHYSEEFLKTVKEDIVNKLYDTYANIPVEFKRW